jgi:hypothetical protein
LGAAYAALAGGLIIAGADLLIRPTQEPVVRVFALGGIVPALIVALGIAFLLPGILALLAGLGVLLRKQWGRILTLIVAVLAILLGLLWGTGVQDAVQDLIDLAVAVVQILYGVMAFVILSTKGTEFSRCQV